MTDRGKYLLFLTAALAALVGVGTAQPRATFSNGAKSVTIPLDIDNNIIRMKIRVNGSRPLTMIFDTGASVTGIDERFVTELGLKTTGDKLNGKGTGGNFTGGYVASSTLSVDGAEVTAQPLATYAMNNPPGFDFDGIIGYDFIKAFVVEIDYQTKTMTLTDPRAFVYRGKGRVVPLILKERKTPLIATRLQHGKHFVLTPRLELDTGFDAAFALGGWYAAKHYVLHHFFYGKHSAAHGAGGEQQRILVKFSSAAFGGFTFRQPPVFFAVNSVGSDADRSSDGVIGGEVLRRFKLIIDYSRSRMILEPNSDLRSPFDLEDGD